MAVTKPQDYLQGKKKTARIFYLLHYVGHQVPLKLGGAKYICVHASTYDRFGDRAPKSI